MLYLAKYIIVRMFQVIGILKYLTTSCKDTVGLSMEMWQNICRFWELGDLDKEMVILKGL